MFLFSQQSSQTQLLTSVLTTMQLSCALEGKEIQSVIAAPVAVLMHTPTYTGCKNGII